MIENNRLNNQGLFIVGNIRSGTSILWQALNTSPDICLLYEPLLYLNADEPNFVDWYRTRMNRYMMGIHKGTYAPRSRWDEEKTALGTLDRLADAYKYVGEKTVFETRDEYHQKDFVSYHLKKFPDSHYFIIVRNPTETVWSILKRWPFVEPHLAYRFWLWSIEAEIDILEKFPNAYMIIFDNFSMETPETIARILGVEVNMPPGMISRKSRNTNIDTMKLPEHLVAFQNTADICVNVFNSLKSQMSKDTLSWVDPEQKKRYIQEYRKKIGQALDELNVIGKKNKTNDRNTE